MLGMIIVLLFVALIAFIGIKVNNLKTRAREHLLKGTPISDSNIHAGMSNMMEKKHVTKFLNEHPNYSEQSIKELLHSYAEQIMHRNTLPEFSEKVVSKMQGDKKLDKIQTMQFKRTTFIAYGANILAADVVYADRRDEYGIMLNCRVNGDQITVDKYRSDKGDALGF
ncbi:hypothetical protein lbkm_2535 [Lachnospiraceae bacterium KM106-2]|nr:hypothetical protein lbkm_2535 [Lachnospiraceae bacterium KM106-2]